VNRNIGIFDSGVGGLTVLKQLFDNFPDQRFLYYGDSGRAPYGNRSKEDLLLFNKQIISFLLEQKIKLLIMACNTSCALVLDDIAQMVDIPIIDLINPTVKIAAAKTMNKRIVVLATSQTVASHAYQKKLLQVNKVLQVLEIACPELVPIVENGLINQPETIEIVKFYLQKIIEFNADTIIYGCSHYPYFEQIIKHLDQKHNIVNYIDPAKCIIPEVKKYLDLIPSNNKGRMEFWVSGEVSKFESFINNYLQWSNLHLNKHSFS
jgi:glutamate racemase